MVPSETAPSLDKANNQKLKPKALLTYIVIYPGNGVSSSMWAMHSPMYLIEPV
jgi:hypothetical protein